MVALTVGLVFILVKAIGVCVSLWFSFLLSSLHSMMQIKEDHIGQCKWICSSQGQHTVW